MKLIAEVKPSTGFIKGEWEITAHSPERPDLSTRFSIIIPNKRTAERLKRAIDAGVAWTNVKVSLDVHGKEYITFDGHVTARYANADLKRLGF